MLDDSKYRRAFGAGATSLDAGVRETVAWARGVYGGRTAHAAPPAHSPAR